MMMECQTAYNTDTATATGTRAAPTTRVATTRAATTRATATTRAATNRATATRATVTRAAATGSTTAPNRTWISLNRSRRINRTTNVASRVTSSTTHISTMATTLTSTPSRRLLPLLAIFLLLATDGLASLTMVKADDFYASTTPLSENGASANATLGGAATTNYNMTHGSGFLEHQSATSTSSSPSSTPIPLWSTTARPKMTATSFFSRFVRRFSTGNELWDGLIGDCYQEPTFSCFQKNVYGYLSDALDSNDVNVTQRLKFFRNQVDFSEHRPTEAAAAQDGESVDDEEAAGGDAHLLRNEIPHDARAAAETPIEEVTNALYGKSVKFAMTHDIELKLPEVMFDGATFRISPRSIEGNGLIAKLELIPKQEVEARLAGKIIMKKIQKFLKSKLLLSFLALVLIIKIIKIKLFWLLPLVIGVGAAKKLLLKFLLFLFPALSHLFKLCSYYQQTYHSTKYHHHHHLINHHHTIVPAWHHSEHHPGPELIYTDPPKGHPSAYLHGAPIHETYGPPSHEHFDAGWESSGPGLGSEYISDINRVAQIDGNSNYFKPNSNDANELHAWGLGTTQSTTKQQQQHRAPATQQQRPPSLKQQQQQQKQPHVSSHSFNPFIHPDKQSVFGTNVKLQPQQQQQPQHSMPGPVYTPPRNAGAPPGGQAAAQIAAQYDPSRINQQQQQQPELSAQLKEAIRIQAEQRLIAQQQQILDKQPFVQDGQPIMPKNYDPFYSPILLKIDKIVEQLGVTDDLCKERLVCSMYKDPNRYSPHSNFVSAELSRDTSELQPVTNANQAVLRFYRLIQAARDGQDQRDCLQLYPQCNINTE